MKWLALALLLIASPAFGGGTPVYSKLIVNPGSVANCQEPVELRIVSRRGGESVIASGLGDLDCVVTPYAPAGMRLCCGATTLCGPYTDMTTCRGGACAWAQCARTLTP